MPQRSNTHISDIWLVRVENSNDGGSVGSLVGALANAEHEQGLGIFNNRVDKAMAGFAKLNFVTARKFTRQGVRDSVRIFKSPCKDLCASKSNSVIEFLPFFERLGIESKCVTQRVSSSSVTGMALSMFFSRSKMTGVISRSQRISAISSNSSGGTT